MSKAGSETTALEPVLIKLRWRARLRAALWRASRGACCGAVLAAMLAVAASIIRPEWVRAALWLAPLSIPLLAMLGALAGLLGRVDDLQIARALDRAAASSDRFASALQLAGHHRRARARLLLEDALAAVDGTPALAAIPLRVPRELKWMPAPVLCLGVLLWLVPGPQRIAQAAPPPEVTPEEWAQVYEEFRRELDDLPEADNPEDVDLRNELEKLAEMLRQQPDKKEALARLSELQAKLERRRQDLGTPSVSLRQAASAMHASQALSEFSARLQAGEYDKAAAALEALAQRLDNNQPPMTASDFEAAATDLDQLAKQIQSPEELKQACRNCATASSSMNRSKLSGELKKLSKCMSKNACTLKRCDRVCRSCNMLDALKQRLGRCGACKSGRFVCRNAAKGGLRAGWGTMANWTGGALSNQHEQREADVIDPAEQEGMQTSHTTVSPQEEARSTQDYRERYAELVRKAEADLALEVIPAVYREYLRKYFVAIRPVDAPAETGDK
jgi:hypothetical protein